MRATGYTLACIACIAVYLESVGIAVNAEVAEIPPLNARTVARLNGIDEETLSVISVTAEQRKKLLTSIAAYIEEEEPKLLTYRILWIEARERLRNLKASAAENAFDPCQFVTDEAIEKAQAEVETAQASFENHCRAVAEKFEAMVTDWQCRIIRNARKNCGLRSPYRWLCLEEPQKKQMKRLISMHEARMKLAERYPHLKDKLPDTRLNEQIMSLLNEKQKVQLEKLMAERPKLREQREEGKSQT